MARPGGEMAAHDRRAAEALKLVWPAREHLDSYVDALERGWSPDSLRPEAAQEHLARVALDADAFLASMIDREAKGGPVKLPDGSEAARLPGFVRWMWDGEFCGSIGFRWQPGTTDLPPYCPGHIGYAVVPWKQGRGYATRALQLLLPNAKQEGLEFVLLNTVETNIASQRVIEANGGVLVEKYPDQHHHGATALRYRIDL